MTAVCPRLFEFLTTLTFGALRKNHIVSTALETVAKKNKRIRQKQRKPVVHVRSAMYHESSRTQLKFGRGCYVKKQDLTSMAVPQNKTISAIVHKFHRKGFISMTGLIDSENEVRKKLMWLWLFFDSKQMICNCDHFDREGMGSPEGKIVVSLGFAWGCCRSAQKREPPFAGFTRSHHLVASRVEGLQ